MTDPVTPVPTDPAAPAATQPSPLDMLEQILNDTKAAGAAAPAAPAAGDPAAPSAAPAEPAGPSDEEKLAAVHQLEAEQNVEDQALLQQKVQELAAIKDTPAYQARVQQDDAKKEAEAAQDVAGAGYQIQQLGHTKI